MSKKLCLDLAYSETEAGVIELLRKASLWDDPEAWCFYGDNVNNYADIGNQQSKPDAALVEKVINSVDAMLMRECLRRRVDPEGSNAPRTLSAAVTDFFSIQEGVLANISPTERTKLARNILIVATGERKNPCYSIIDKGEGQTPAKMPNTFLSLTNKSNKLRIPFVQGKFNMGGTGALTFSGYHNLQLIISRRDPKIVSAHETDSSAGKWGFTVVRREDPTGNVRSSVYRYLAPKGKVLTFEAEELPLLPGEYPKAYENPLEWGTFIKLYEYQLVGALKAPVYFDLYYRLSILLPNIALPVLLCERRKGYRAQSHHITMSGLSVRLEEDKSENIEPGFPSSSTMKIRGQEMKIQIYVFKRDKKKHYSREEGVAFTVNGQTHGFIKKYFFSRHAVGMDYLNDSILVIADCSDFEGRSREDLFMNSRDRLKEGDLKREIDKKLEDLLRNHQGLRELKTRRRREDMEGKIGDAKPLIDVLEKVIKNSPTLSQLFIKGIKVTNPFDLTNSGEKEEYTGREFPTYFKLKKDFPQERPKECPVNQRFRVQFETDAKNDYFTRDKDSGKFRLFLHDGSTTEDYTLNLWNGIANLTVELPHGSRVTDVIEFTTEVNDISRVSAFSTKFYVHVTPAATKRPGGKGGRKKPPDKNTSGDRESPTALDLPAIKEVHRHEWERYKFTEKSALSVRDSGESGYDFYLNMDNAYLLNEIKGRSKADPEIQKAQYKYGMILLGLSLLRAFREQKSEGNGDAPMDENIRKFTSAVAPMLLPMIATLGTLQEE